MFKKVIVILACLCLCSCASSRRGPDTTILEYQKQADRTEEELRARDRAIDNAIRDLDIITREVEDITARSETMGGTIEEIIYEFDLYHTAVQRLLRAAGYRTDEEQAVEEDTDKPDKCNSWNDPGNSSCTIPGTDTQN